MAGRGGVRAAVFPRRQMRSDPRTRWILAPVLRSSVELQAGYAFAADDADETCFGPLSQPSVSPRLGRPHAPQKRVRICPITLPHVVKHSMIGALVGNPRSRAIVRVDWSYALRATSKRSFSVGIGRRTRRGSRVLGLGRRQLDRAQR